MPERVDHDERRRLISDAFWRVAAAEGVEAATIRRVATAGGVSVGLVQHYFASRDELVLFALRQVELDPDRELVLAPPPHGPSDPYEAIRTLLTGRLPQPDRRLRVQARLACLGRPGALPELDAYLRTLHRALCGYLAAQLSDGRLRTGVEPTTAAEILLALVDGLSTHVLQGFHDLADAETMLTAHLDGLFAGVDPAADVEQLAGYRRELEAHCYRMLGSVQDAEDVVQETLLRAWRRRPGFDGRGPVRPWLYRIATNRCLTLLDSRRRRPLEPFPDDRLEETPEQSAEQRYAQRESVELAFVAALQHLPARQRAALVLCEVLGFSSREAADILAGSTSSVNSALQRARATLRERRPALSQQAEQRAVGDDGVRDLARRYAAAWEAGDVETIVAMLADDARYAMPPEPATFTGPAGIRSFLVSGPMEHRWRFVPARANGQLAFGTYLWDGTAWRAGGLDVLTLRGDRIVEVVSFLDPGVFAAFGLPLTDDSPAPAGC